MKLSQIRTLSWGGSLVLSTLFAGLAFQLVTKIQALPKPTPQKWTPLPPADLDQLAKKALIEQQDILNALSFLTKLEVPPVVITAKPTEPGPVKEKPTVPVGDILNDGKVTLIAYDDNGGGHVAFIKKGFKPSHPYFENDDLMTSPASRVSRIFRDHVVLEDDKGRKQTLYLGDGDQKSRGGKTTRGGSGASSAVKRVASPPKPVPSKVVAAPEKNPVANKAPSPPKQRYVPSWRKTVRNEDYGIDVVEYSPAPDGSRRFAINDKDLQALQGNPLRLMSEVLPSTAYDGNGKAMGIRLDFISEDALAKAYGVRDGDVVTHLNGKAIADENQAMGVYESLDGKQRTVPVTIKRDGKSFNVILEMDDFPSAPKR